MFDDAPVMIEKTRDQGIACLTAFHRSMPELRVEASTRESALERLAGHLALGLDYVMDDFHRDLINRALIDVNQIRSRR